MMINIQRPKGLTQPIFSEICAYVAQMTHANYSITPKYPFDAVFTGPRHLLKHIRMLMKLAL